MTFKSIYRFIQSFIFAISICAVLYSEISVSKGTFSNQNAVIIKNSLTKLTVLPGIGGRIISFKLINTPLSETIYTARHHIKYSPTDHWAGIFYGGINDVDSPGWPGGFWDKLYTFERKDDDSFSFTAEHHNVKIEKKIRLIPESTIVQYDAKLINTGKTSVKKSIRIHAELAVGDFADTNDTIYIQNDSTLREISYKPGWENPRFTYERAEYGWAAIADKRDKTALIRLFKNPEEENLLLVWHGHNEGGYVRDEKGGFYAMDRMLPAVEIKPDNATVAEEEMYIIKGLSRIDFVNEYTAGDVTTDRFVYNKNMEANLTVRIGSAVNNGPFEVFGAYNGHTNKETIKNIAAGKTQECVFHFQADPGKEEAYLIVKNPDGKVIAELKKTIKTDSRAYENITVQIKKLNVLTEQISESFSKKNLSKFSSQTSCIDFAKMRLEEFEKRKAVGNFTKVNEHYQNVYKELSEMALKIQNISASEQEAAKETEKLLKRFGIQ